MKVRNRALVAIAILFSINYLSLSGQKETKPSLKMIAGIKAGYNRGFGIAVNIVPVNFADELPFRLRLGAGYSFLNPGNAADARRIFINNNTNGTPQKKGASIDLRLDFLISRRVFGLNTSQVVFGPRFSTFKGNFKYIGGNEDFDVTSNQFGLGAGFENHFKMNQKMNLVLSYGLDLYAPSKLTGHDTSYSPDNDNINPHTDNQNDNTLFRYRDANRAIKQPFIMPYIMIGVNFGL